MNNKFIRKYMRLAKQIGSDQIPCLSRGIGTVIVNPKENRILGTGYNGPPRGTPHCDSKEYLRDIVYPQLSVKDKEYITKENNYDIILDGIFPDDDKRFSDKYDGCKTCPRKLVGAKSGERLELCSCAHSEQNAIINAGQSVYGGYLFCWCGPPCFDICAKAIVNAGISKVYCKAGDESIAYASYKTKWLFKSSGIELIQLEESWINSND